MIKQLETLAKEIDVDYIPSNIEQKPLDIAKHALQTAHSQVADVLIVDTAGRLHVDSVMMDVDRHAATHAKEPGHEEQHGPFQFLLV